MANAIEMRHMLWNWARAYPERAGDSVSWPRLAAFGREMASGHRENPDPVRHEEAEEVDAAVLQYLNTVRRRKDREKANLEGMVFWLRYYYRWEQPDIARKVQKSVAWVKNMCSIVENSVETVYLMQQEAA